MRRRRVVGVLTVLGILASGALAFPIPVANAAEYPSWADVAAARNDVAANEAAIRTLEGLLAGLRVEADRTAADALAKSLVYEEADLDYQEGVLRAETLQRQADEARKEADASELQAGQMAARLARSASGDITASLLTNLNGADELLSGLGMADKFSEQAEAIYTKAIQASQTAASLTDQADLAEVELEKLKVIAERAFADAQEASNAAAAAVAEQETRQVELNAQLAFLKDKQMTVEAGYEAGVRERARIAAEAAAAAARAAAEAAAAAARAGVRTAGLASASGWASPMTGRITSPYGFRTHPVSGAWRLHTGVDLAAGCGQAIYAASGGVVTYVGPNGTFGNWVEIRHANGVSTGYAHIQNGGILVSYGQEVGVGAVIARAGSTGSSTGCHLHFEVRVNGVARDPVAFLANHGIRLG